MRNFNRGRSDGGRSFGKRNFNGDRGGRPQMHNAICSNCGKECQVPFKPTGEKPVYCRDCFAKINGQDLRKSFTRNDRSERPQFRTFAQNTQNQSGENSQLKAINAKLDKILALLASTSNNPEVAEPVQEENAQ